MTFKFPCAAHKKKFTETFVRFSVNLDRQHLETLLEGKTVHEVLDQKKLYFIDLRYLADIECANGAKLPGPTCLLYVRNSGDVVPVAIQLMPEPADDNPVSG